MQPIIILLHILLIPLTYAINASNTKISTQRLAAPSDQCSTLPIPSETQTTTTIVPPYLSLSEEQIELILQTNSYNQFNESVIPLIIAHIVSFGILLCLLPWLLCCCVRPEKYPPCESLRKSSSEMYTRKELKYPAYLLLVLFLICLGASAAGVHTSTEIPTALTNTFCQFHTLIDNTLNGNVNTDNKTFFVGLLPLHSELKEFEPKYATFYNQGNISFNTTSTIKNKQEAIELEMETMYNDNTIDETYTSAFRDTSGVNYIPVTSNFKEQFYGPLSDNDKILGKIFHNLTNIFIEINNTITPSLEAWSTLFSKPSITPEINQTLSQIETINQSLNSFSVKFSTLQNNININRIETLIKAYYGLVITITLFGVVSAAVIAIYTVVRIRIIGYVACGGITIMITVGFAVLSYLTIIKSNLGEVCLYLDESINSGHIETVLGLIGFAEAKSIYNECLPNLGNENILDSFTPTLSTLLTAIKTISTIAQTFTSTTPSFTSATISTPLTLATTTLNSLKSSTLLEIPSSGPGFSFLTLLSEKGISPSASCTANYDLDSWVLSRQIMNCDPLTLPQVICSNLADPAICPDGCYQINEEFNNPGGDTSYASSLFTRYGAACNYADFLIDLQDNYLTPMRSRLTNIQTKITSLNTNKIQPYYTQVSSVSSSLSSFKSTISTNFNSELILETGSFYGNNCSTLGESINKIKNNICSNNSALLSALHFHFIILCIICYSGIIIVALTVCVGTRHYLHLQKMQLQIGYKGVPINISLNAIDSKNED